MATTSTIKNCSTCGHKVSGKCVISGVSIALTRIYNHVGDCGSKFEMWEPRPGFLQRTKVWFFGAQK